MHACFITSLWRLGSIFYLVTTLALLAFMEFLVQQDFSVSTIVNYMAGIRSYFIVHGLAYFRDDRFHLFL